MLKIILILLALAGSVTHACENVNQARRRRRALGGHAPRRKHGYSAHPTVDQAFADS
jgi:hypothetical protein